MEIPIDKILEKYSVSAPDRSVRKQVVTVIEDITGVSVSFEQVSYRNGKIRVDTSPLQRSQIYMHKEAILKRIETDIDTANIKDVR